MNNLLNQKHTLAKLRAELERRRERICQCCKRFRHLVYNCRNKKVKIKKKLILQNQFKVIVSKVREEVKVRKQETVEEVRCFRY